jgi:hypothetical protein
MTARIRRLNADGATPIRLANRSLKLPRLLKPTSMQTSVTEYSLTASSCFARSSRAPMRN